MTKIEQHAHFEFLKLLIPISQLTENNMMELMNNTHVETLEPGRALFSKGDTDSRTYYLLAGQLELHTGDGTHTDIHGQTPSARHPIDHHFPRQVTAIANTPVEFLSIDNNYLDTLLTRDQNVSLAVSGTTSPDSSHDVTPGDADWMSNILRSKIFQRIPPENIQPLLKKMKPQQFSDGDTVIQQGDDGDYYYYINKGRRSVSRVIAAGEAPTLLAELAAGSSFGEEALVSGAQRNATITMISDGELICLAKNDFDELLKAPIVKTVSFSDAEQMVANGAIWLDVRLKSEFDNNGLPDSMNAPLPQLRNRIRGLQRDKKYIIYCDTGRRSASAAYLLSERNIDTYVLEGGLVNINRTPAQNN